MRWECPEADCPYCEGDGGFRWMVGTADGPSEEGEECHHHGTVGAEFFHPYSGTVPEGRPATAWPMLYDDETLEAVEEQVAETVGSLPVERIYSFESLTFIERSLEPWAWALVRALQAHNARAAQHNNPAETRTAQTQLFVG